LPGGKSAARRTFAWIGGEIGGITACQIRSLICESSYNVCLLVWFG
jgi:hypothetical protein